MAPAPPKETKRGRPPSKAINDRDRAVIDALQQPRTRNDLAEHLGLKPSIVYLALTRLRARGKVRACLGAGGQHVWTRDVNAPCP